MSTPYETEVKLLMNVMGKEIIATFKRHLPGDRYTKKELASISMAVMTMLYSGWCAEALSAALGEEMPKDFHKTIEQAVLDVVQELAHKEINHAPDAR